VIDPERAKARASSSLANGKQQFLSPCGYREENPQKPQFAARVA
jgi:hypothetical protein